MLLEITGLHSFGGSVIFHCVYMLRFLYPFIHWWHFGWFHILAMEIVHLEELLPPHSFSKFYILRDGSLLSLSKNNLWREIRNTRNGKINSATGGKKTKIKHHPYHRYRAWRLETWKRDNSWYEVECFWIWIGSGKCWKLGYRHCFSIILRQYLFVLYF